MIIRNDDVNANTVDLKQTYDIINSKFPDCIIYSCTSVLAKYSISGAIYPKLPLKDQPLDYFFDVDRVKSDAWFVEKDFPNVKVISHGLWHFDHTKVESQLKKASIISSCRLLYTDTFVPPFNKWDNEMESICLDNGITMIKSNESGWKSFEHNKFDPSHELWYFHSWRWKHQELKDYLGV